jgi:hypothetical protein
MLPATVTTTAPNSVKIYIRFFNTTIFKSNWFPKSSVAVCQSWNWVILIPLQKRKKPIFLALAKLVDEGYDLIAPVPSCVLMYKQELPLLFPDDEDVIKVQKAFFDPFEYLCICAIRKAL